jgi:preprotein translocase subunit YajC
VEILLAVILIVLFYFILMGRVEQQCCQRQDISDLRGMKLTPGGILATVKEIRVPEEGPVQLVLDLGGGVEVRAVTSAVEQRLKSASAPVPEKDGRRRGANGES